MENNKVIDVNSYVKACRWLTLFLLVMLSACSFWSSSVSDEAMAKKAAAEASQLKPGHQVDVINKLNQVVNTLRYRACGEETEFLTLAENLKPQQRVTINVQEACVTLKAFNAFNDELKSVSQMQLSKNNKWEIK